nr:hypothetical protein [Tanacetum cinerariifolium]
MHAVPPPMTGIYMPPKFDFGIDESKFTYGPKQSKNSKSDAKTSDFASCESNSSVETLESVHKPVESKPKVVSEPKVWSDALIIEEYESDSDDEYVFKALVEQEKPNPAFINTGKHVKTNRQTVKDQDTYSQNPKVPKRDWTGLMPKRLGLGYGYTRRHALVVLEVLMRKVSSDYPGDRKFVKLQEKYVQVFKDPISFDVDVNSVDGGNDRDGDDDGDDDNDDGNGNNDEELNDDNDDGNGNNDEELNDDNDDGNRNNYEELNDYNDDGIGNNDEELNDEDTLAKECEIMSTPENYTQWLERNADLVGEIIDAITEEYLYGDLFGDNYVRMEVLNQVLLASDRMPTRASNASASPRKRIVKPSSYLLSPYMNKKTKVVPKITRLKFSIGNSLFAMQVKRSQGLWIDANVIDCWGVILNHEEKVRDAKSKLRHGTVGRLKHGIPELKWRTSRNFHDCGVFTMLHMESFNGETTTKWDCGLFAESGLQYDMLRRLRFKFATKILLHEINVHSKKMLELANEFDKVDSLDRMAIIIKAVKNREERDRI